tara:strand:+ start:1257 stop:1607 length:351 start_codon:yes stop_codon:yes gene_type:complete
MLKKLIKFCLCVLPLSLVGCIDIGKEASSSSSSKDKPFERVALNFNESNIIDLSALVEAHPTLTRIIVESEGIAGVSVSAEEARQKKKFLIGGAGVKGYYNYTVLLSDGSKVEGRL